MQQLLSLNRLALLEKVAVPAHTAFSPPRQLGVSYVNTFKADQSGEYVYQNNFLLIGAPLDIQSSVREPLLAKQEQEQ